jgi:Uma2 family endonuclease
MSTATLDKSKFLKANKRTLLPLRNGEHLSRGEFERRWDAMPHLKHAELIEGIVFMPPPTSEMHSESHSDVFLHLGRYASETGGVVARITPSIRLDNKNEFQPDCLLRIESPTLGRSRISADNYIEGAPELVAEVAVSSSDYDSHEKRDVYERMGVQEYLLWRVMDARLDWWTLRDGTYVALKPRHDGVHCSQVFPGLWLDPRALLAGEHRRIATVLDKGLRSAEHAAFVKKLAAKQR